MSIIVLNMDMPSGCQKCKFFRKLLFGNGLDYSYSCILGAKDFPMPWIRQIDERASDCPIKLFEQEPCDDCISRKAVLSLVYADWKYEGLESDIENLPSVTPPLKTGHWLNGELIPNDITGHWYAECSECGKVRIVDNYCPNCGAEMQEEIKK